MIRVAGYSAHPCIILSRTLTFLNFFYTRLHLLLEGHAAVHSMVTVLCCSCCAYIVCWYESACINRKVVAQYLLSPSASLMFHMCFRHVSQHVPSPGIVLVYTRCQAIGNTSQACIGASTSAPTHSEVATDLRCIEDQHKWLSGVLSTSLLAGSQFAH